MNKFKLIITQGKNKPISSLQVILTVIFVACLMLSNIISSRIFNFFGFNMTSAVIIFPITYILSDVFSEVYGYAWSRTTRYLGFIINFFAVLLFLLVSILPTFDWAISDAQAFNTVLRGSFACTMASFVAFLIGDFVNDIIFAKMKQKHSGLLDHKGFGVRALLSSLVGEFCDSAIYMPLAFLVFNPIMQVKDVIIMIFMQAILKTAYEAVIFPVTLLIVKRTSKYEHAYLNNFQKAAVTN